MRQTMIMSEACYYFRKFFPEKEFNEFLDPLSTITLKPILDIFKFDDFLHEKHGNYEKKMSMKKLLETHYGEEAILFFEELLKN
jgi:hypothetical protein